MVIDRVEVQRPLYPTTPLGETIINLNYLDPLYAAVLLSRLNLISCQGLGDLEKLSATVVESMYPLGARRNHFYQYVLEGRKFSPYDESFLVCPPSFGKSPTGIVEIPHLIGEETVGEKLLDTLVQVSEKLKVNFVAVSVYWPNTTRAEIVNQWKKRGANLFYLEPSKRD